MGKKATFILDDQVFAQAKELVEGGLFKSMNAFVESAVKDEIEKVRREQIKEAIVQASTDPLFLTDIEEIERDFEYADFDEERK